MSWKAWVSLAARVVLGGAILYAGLLKIGDLNQSVVAVKAYELPFPAGLITLIGYALPIVEIVLGAAIVAGVLTRWTALLGGLMMVVYIIGLSSAWARGLNIDCGCFTPGGALSPDQKADYLKSILRDVGFTALAVWVVLWPRTPLSVDAWIAGPEADAA